MRTNKSVHIPQDVILVSSGDQALATGAFNTTGNSVNLANLQLGVLSEDQHSATKAPNNYLTAGNTSVQVHQISVVQGTPNSANLSNVSPFKVNDPAFHKSAIINAKNVLSVTTTLPEVGEFDMQLMSGFTAPTVNIDYTLGVTLESHKRDLEWTLNKRDRTAVATHTVTGTPTSPTDELLQNWAVDLNILGVNGGGVKPFIVFGIKNAPATVTAGSFVVGEVYTILTVGTTDYTLIGASANTIGVTFTATGVGAGSGTATVGTRINSITATKSIPFMTHSNTTYSFTSSTTFVNSLTQAISAGLTATAGIQVLDKSTAGTAASIDQLLIVGLDEREAAIFDDWDVKKVRVFSDTALANTTTDVAKAKEGTGNGKNWKKIWQDRAAFRGITYARIGHPYAVSIDKLPTPIDENTLYTATIIEFEKNVEQLTDSFTVPHRLVILLPATVTNATAAAGTAYTIATTPSTTVTQLNASLGAWLSSASDNFSNIDYREGATKAAPFV